jgi:chromosome segregation ATPase
MLGVSREFLIREIAAIEEELEKGRPRVGQLEVKIEILQEERKELLETIKGNEAVLKLFKEELEDLDNC